MTAVKSHTARGLADLRVLLSIGSGTTHQPLIASTVVTGPADEPADHAWPSLPGAQRSPGTSTPPNGSDLQDVAALVLRDHLNVDARPGPMPGGDSTVLANGAIQRNGMTAVTAWVTVYRGVDDIWPPPPCAGCAIHRQPDGSVVHVGNGELTADGALYIDVILFRPDRTDIGIGVTYHLPAAELPRFPDNALIETVTDPRLAPIE